MTIKPNEIIYVYNSGDENSLRAAQEYSLMRQVPADQLLGLDVFTSSILDNRQEFEDQILNPIKNAIESLGGFNKKIKACILGFRVPAGYNSEHGVISSCSALAAMYTGSKGPVYNPSYKKENRGSSINDFNIMPTCQHDMPTYSVLKRKIAEFASFKDNVTSDGYFYFDRWSLSKDLSYDSYAAELEDFETNLVKNYFKRYYVTSEPIEGLRSDFGIASNDSFFWSAGMQNLTQSFFKSDKKSNRIFFFNADTDSLKSFRSDNQFGPAIAALYSGYQSVAGMMSEFSFNSNLNPYDYDPYSNQSIEASDCWLRPEPYFKALTLDIGLLEAMYFASPILCCPMTYFADPCMKAELKDSLALMEKMNGKELWEYLHLRLSEVGALANNRIKSAYDLISRVGTYSGIEDQLWAINNYKYIQPGNDPNTLKSFLQPSVSSWKKFIEIAYHGKLESEIPSFLRNFGETQFKLTRSFLDINMNKSQISSEIDSSKIEPSGFFYVETYLPDVNIGTGYIDVKAEIYEDIDDESPALESISYDDVDNWFFEDFNSSMKKFPSQGIFSSLTNRKIRFINKREIPNKTTGDKVWVKFTFFVSNGLSATSDLKEAMILS
jgi:uncharacterized protein (TIGR03790 family)